MKQFKIMIAILMMATTGISLAAEVDNSDTYTLDNQNGDAYAEGSFNFTENGGDQDVTSTISDNAVVHGDTSANVAGNQNNCYEAGSCVTGSNGGVIQTLTAGSGNILDGDGQGGAGIGGHFVTLEVPVYTYEQITDTDGNVSFQKVQETVTQADIDEDIAENGSSDLVLGPQFKQDTQWVGYNSTEAALIQSNNNLAAQKIAANANTTQTIKSAPSMGAPSINASNSDMCRHGVSAAASMIGMGFSGGVTLIDKNCELIKQVRLLSNLGLSDVALALLGQDSRVAKAMLQADPARYGQFLNAETVRDLEAESANAEAVVNGDEVKYQNADADQVIIDESLNGSDDKKQAKDVGANGFPMGDLLNLPIFNWLN